MGTTTMNQEKAREFFSAYYEGTLEAGLSQTFEQRLKADSQLQDEYRTFEATMSELDTLKFEEIEIPSFLSDRIATRLEEVQEKAKAKNPVWTLWLRGLAFGGVATLAILGAIAGYYRTEGPSTSQIVPTSTSDSLKLDTSGPNVVMNYQSSQREQMSISSGGTLLKSLNLDAGTRVKSPLENDQAGAALFEVSVRGKTTVIAIPGTQRQTSNATSGTLKAFAAAMADFYRTPVELEVADAEKTVNWSFEGGRSAAGALQGAPYSVVELDNGVIEIKDR